MKDIWSTIQLVFSAIGGTLGYVLGGMDGMLYTLLVFVTVDYLTGMLCAIADRKLSSEVGFQGIARKVIIFTLVGIAHLLDVQILGKVGVLRAMVIFFYVSNEGISIIENATHLGLPIPEKLKSILEQLKDKEGGK
ncbi:TPA: phage holin family protein [Streptococcus suis]|nr:phage holin family protein [Streptococcus suis]HEL1597960.1 phage holin family protein [Streptococcus suis]HEL1599842.1 phage holin family protein [Streptococcus suis]HEL1761107.1 phage holin family protein [Streptococcus suis]HEL9645035.1 phage holin family protein [Streptococcus suis]